MRFFALPERCVKTDRSLAVDALEKDRVAVFVHGQSSRQSCDPGQVAQRGQTELGNRGLLADQVAETQEVESEHVARTRVNGPQETGRTERPRERERGALGNLQVTGNLRDAGVRAAGAPRRDRAATRRARPDCTS